MRKIIHFILNIFYFLSKYFIRKKNLVIFGAWFGTQVTDNPMYLLKDFIDKKLYSEYEFVWIGNKECYAPIRELFKGRVRFCRRNSLKAYLLELRASYVFVNQGYLDLGSINLLKGAKVIQLWHGFPVKKIVADANNFTQKRPYHHCDYFLSTSRLMDERLLSAFRYWGITKTNIIHVGQPRYIPLINESASSAFKKSLGIPQQATVVSYIPTFRDNTNEVFSFHKLSGKEMKKLEEKNIFIIEKQHFARNNNSKETSSNIVELPKNFDTQLLLNNTDILITDFSSVYIDYLILNRPIIHFVYDLDKFINDDRGLYRNDFSQDAAGPVVRNTEELINVLMTHDFSKDEQQRVQLNLLFNEYPIEKIGQIIKAKVGM